MIFTVTGLVMRRAAADEADAGIILLLVVVVVVVVVSVCLDVQCGNRWIEVNRPRGRSVSL
jgi:hypothetical protein